jgi:hypothetical protein
VLGAAQFLLRLVAPLPTAALATSLLGMQLRLRELFVRALWGPWRFCCLRFLFAATRRVPRGILARWLLPGALGELCRPLVDDFDSSGAISCGSRGAAGSCGATGRAGYRTSHACTVCRDTPNRAATSVTVPPPAITANTA